MIIVTHITVNDYNYDLHELKSKFWRHYCYHNSIACNKNEVENTNETFPALNLRNQSKYPAVWNSNKYCCHTNWHLGRAYAAWHRQWSLCLYCIQTERENIPLSPSFPAPCCFLLSISIVTLNWCNIGTHVNGVYRQISKPLIWLYLLNETVF